MHDHEITIDVPLVRQLLQEQFPQWANFSLEPIKSIGTDNAIFKLGLDKCIRLPRIPGVDKVIEQEQKWLSTFAEQLPIQIPQFLGKGIPNKKYPFQWAVYSWVEGETISAQHDKKLDKIALDLAGFVKALQAADTTNAPHSSRGGSLLLRDAAVRNAISVLHDRIEVKLVTQLWENSLQAPICNKPLVWIHADLLPGNILVQNGRLSGVIDFDLFGIGDPATDLICAWSIFTKSSRYVFREALDIDDATWMRGKGWALSIALMIIPYYQNTNPGLVAIAQRMIKELLED